MLQASATSLADIRNNNFDCIRLIAALMVFVSHLFPLYGMEEPKLSIGDGGYITFGNLGVTIFFVVSGFLVTSSYDRRKGRVEHFIYARLLRIYPAYIVNFFVVTCLIGFFGSTLPWQEYFSTLYDQLFYLGINWSFFYSAPLPGAFEGNPIGAMPNGPIWTLPYELLMYGVILLLLVLQQKFIPLLVLVSTIVWGGVLFYLWGFNPPDNTILGFIFCFSFLLGSLLYHHCQNIPRNLWACLALICVLVWLHEQSYFYLLYCFAVAYSVFCLAFMNWRGAFCRLHRYGDYSYGIYIYGWPVCQLAYIIYPKDFMWFALSSGLGCFGCAYLSWHLIEKPALSFKKKLQGSL